MTMRRKLIGRNGIADMLIKLNVPYNSGMKIGQEMRFIDEKSKKCHNISR